MKFEPIDIELKDGKIITIREAITDDADELRKVVKEYVEESEFIPYAQGEFRISLEEEQKWIDSFSVIPNALLLVATYERHIVGNMSMNVSVKKMLQHSGGIGLGMLKEWRGKGIGSALFDNLIRWAKEKSTLEILWLETAKDNMAGQALYNKFGFRKIGIFPKFIKHLDGTYTDSITMILNLK